MILIVVLIPDSLFALKISLVLLFQVAYIAYVVLVKIFTKIDQVVEVVNEFVILILFILLIKYRSETKGQVQSQTHSLG